MINRPRQVLVKTEPSGICNGVSLVRGQRCSSLLHKKTRELSSFSEDDRTVNLDVVA